MRSAYDVDRRPDTHWLRDARCAAPDVDPELWHLRTGDIAITGGEASHICRSHCPVIDECRRNAEAMGAVFRQSTVQAGVIYQYKGVPAKSQPVAVKCRLCGTPQELDRRVRRREQWRRSGAKKTARKRAAA
jgi:hypothetical protein